MLTIQTTLAPHCRELQSSVYWRKGPRLPPKRLFIPLNHPSFHDAGRRYHPWRWYWRKEHLRGQVPSRIRLFPSLWSRTAVNGEHGTWCIWFTILHHIWGIGSFGPRMHSVWESGERTGLHQGVWEGEDRNAREALEWSENSKLRLAEYRQVVLSIGNWKGVEEELLDKFVKKMELLIQ